MRAKWFDSGTGWRRISHIGLLLVLLGGGGSLQWLSWTRIRETREQIAAREDLTVQLKQSAKRLLPVAASPDAASSRPNLYLTDKTDTIAAAALQTYVLGILEANAAAIQSTRVSSSPPAERSPEAPAEAGTGRKINLEVTFDGRIAGIQRILFQLETGSPALFIAELQMQPLRTIAPGNEPDADPVLHVVLALYGFWRT